MVIVLCYEGVESSRPVSCIASSRAVSGLGLYFIKTFCTRCDVEVDIVRCSGVRLTSDPSRLIFFRLPPSRTRRNVRSIRR